MRTYLLPFCVILLSIATACLHKASGDEIRLLNRISKMDHFQADSVRLTETEAIAIGKINANLDLDAAIDVIEMPWEDTVRELVRGRRLRVAVDMDALKKAGVTLDGLVTLRRVDLPLRKCLHELLDPVKLTFVVCPDGLLITSVREDCQPAEEQEGLDRE